MKTYRGREVTTNKIARRMARKAVRRMGPWTAELMRKRAAAYDAALKLIRQRCADYQASRRAG